MSHPTPLATAYRRSSAFRRVPGSKAALAAESEPKVKIKIGRTLYARLESAIERNFSFANTLARSRVAREDVQRHNRTVNRIWGRYRILLRVYEFVRP